MIYIMSDIHGCYDEFIEMLEKINFNENDTLYILGDIIDRGDEPLKVLDYVIEHKNIILLLGNHEFMMKDYYYELENNFSKYKIAYARDLWFQNGGDVTYEKLQQCDKQQLDRYLDFISHLNYFKILSSKKTDYLLVHAGIYPYLNMDIKETIKNQTLDDLIWIRRDFIQNDIKLPFKVIFGHTPTDYVYDFVNKYDNLLKTLKKDKFLLLEHYEPYKTVYFNNKIAIDCGCVFGGYLSCLKLDLEKDEITEFYIEPKSRPIY